MANFCPNCGIATNPNDTNCPGCGINLSSENNPNEQQQSFCSMCGATINPNSSQCPKCGNAINNRQPGKKKKNNGCIIAIVGFAILFVIAICFVGLLAFLAYPNFEKARSEARRKACFSNQRVLQGAVEMYNMDNESNMMHKLDMKLLLKGRYIKTMIEGPEPKCSYVSKGDLAKEGNVECTNHGPVFVSR